MSESRHAGDANPSEPDDEDGWARSSNDGPDSCAHHSAIFLTPVKRRSSHSGRSGVVLLVEMNAADSRWVQVHAVQAFQGPPWKMPERVSTHFIYVIWIPGRTVTTSQHCSHQAKKRHRSTGSSVAKRNDSPTDLIQDSDPMIVVRLLFQYFLAFLNVIAFCIAT